MVFTSPEARKAILRLVRRKNLTTTQIIDHLCPPPKFTLDQVRDTLSEMMQTSEICTGYNDAIVKEFK